MYGVVPNYEVALPRKHCMVDASCKHRRVKPGKLYKSLTFAQKRLATAAAVRQNSACNPGSDEYGFVANYEVAPWRKLLCPSNPSDTHHTSIFSRQGHVPGSKWVECSWLSTPS